MNFDTELSKMGYRLACRSIFGYAEVPCGPATSRTETVGMAFDAKARKVVRVHRHGCHTEALPSCDCVDAAITLVRDRTKSRARSLTVVDRAGLATYDPNYKTA